MSPLRNWGALIPRTEVHESNDRQAPPFTANLPSRWDAGSAVIIPRNAAATATMDQQHRSAMFWQ